MGTLFLKDHRPIVEKNLYEHEVIPLLSIYLKETNKNVLQKLHFESSH